MTKYNKYLHIMTYKLNNISTVSRTEKVGKCFSLKAEKQVKNHHKIGFIIVLIFCLVMSRRLLSKKDGRVESSSY